MTSIPTGSMRGLNSSSRTYSFLQEELDWLYNELRAGIPVPHLVAELLDYDSPAQFSEQVPVKERVLVYYALSSLAPIDLRPVIEQHFQEERP